MAYQSLILGVLFSIGVFAVKSGVGLSYVVSAQQKRRSKAGAVMLFALIYLCVFGVAVLALERIDPVAHMAAIRSFIQSGMMLHLLMAGLLMIWGLMLLRRTEGSRPTSRGWLILAVPCPVCVTVIFFSAGFLITCFPDTPLSAVLALYLAFVLINLLTMAVTALYRKNTATTPESFLGAAMLLASLYFFLSVTVMPQFADVENVYRLAVYQGRAHSTKPLHLVPFSILAATAFLGGYGFTTKKIRSLP
jgi:predicted transporter